VDLWQRLETLAGLFPINWVWVKGHAGNKYNERCDKLTKTAIVSL
jgi:ribonuclease HI